MVVNNTWLVENYNRFNELVFGNELPKVDDNFMVKGYNYNFYLGICNAKSYMGIFKRRPLKGYCCIELSRYFDRTEKNLIDTLVHEMVHFYIFYKGIRDSSSHGYQFKSYIAKYNRLHGLTMSVCAHDGDSKSVAVVKKENYYLLFIVAKDGRHFVCNVNKNYTDKVESIRKMWGGDLEHHWYRSNNQEFQTWSKVRGLRGKIVPKAKFDELQAMVKAEGKEMVFLSTRR